MKTSIPALGVSKGVPSRWFGLIFALVGLTLVIPACDPKRIAELVEGVASEGDVRIKFGEPEKIGDGANGAKIFEYNRQPAGAVHRLDGRPGAQ